MLVDPGVFQDIEVFLWKGIGVGIGRGLYGSDIFDTFEDEMFTELSRDYAIRNAVSQGETLDRSRSLVGAASEK
jgi:hypothetical protein